MEKLDYIINPILMGGLVKEINEDMVKVHLHGRLGVITIPEKIILSEIELEPGVELEFHFSYLKVEDAGYDYDYSYDYDSSYDYSGDYSGGGEDDACVEDGLVY